MFKRYRSARVIVLICCIASFSQIPTRGLVAYYPLDSSAVDESGNGNDGIIYSATPTVDRFGKNGAYLFNGAAYIDCGNGTSLQLTTAFTLAAWIRPESLTGGEQKIIHKAESINRGYELFIWNDSLMGRVGGYGTMLTAVSRWVITLDWQLVALVYDGARVKLYRNGTKLYDSACSYPLENAPYNLAIGKRTERSALYFKGALDDIVIYNRALADSEIQVLFTATDWNLPRPELIPIASPTNNRRPAFSWHPVKNATGYTIKVYQSSPDSSPIIIIPMVDTFYLCLADLPVGSIYWKVNSSPFEVWSDISLFIIQPDSVPFLVRYNGGVVSEKRPPFKWHPVNGATGYRIMYADNSLFNNANIVPLADTIFIPLADLSQGTWYWKVSSSRNWNLYSTADSVVIAAAGAVPVASQPWKKYQIKKTDAAITVFINGGLQGIRKAAVYDIFGRLIHSLEASSKNRHMIAWNYQTADGARATPGLYFMKFSIDKEIFLEKVFVQP